MSVERAQGVPNYGRSGAAFIPEIFIKEVNVKYYADSQIPRITKSNPGAALTKVGDTAYLPQRPDIVWKDVKVGENDDPQLPDSTPVTLQVNRLKRYCIVVPDATKQQSQLDIGMEGTTDVAMSLDGELQAVMYKGLAIGKAMDPNAIAPLCAAENTGLTAGKLSGAYNMGTPTVPVVVGPKSMIPFITAFRSVIAEANKNSSLALANVWCTIPEVLRYGLINSDLRKAMEMGDATSIARTGVVGRLVDTTIYTSSQLYQLPSAVNGKQVFAVLAGNTDAIGFVQQMKTAEKIRHADYPADKYRGEVLWDFNVLKASALVVAFVSYDPTA